MGGVLFSAAFILPGAAGPQDRPERTVPQKPRPGTLGQLCHSRMAQHAQGPEADADQSAEQDEKGGPVFCRLPGIFHMLPALQLVEQQLLVLHALPKEIGAPDHLPVRVAHPTDQDIVGRLLPEPLHLQDLVCPGGQIGVFRDFSQELLDLPHGGGVVQNIAPVMDQPAGVHGKEPVPLHLEEKGGICGRTPAHPHRQKHHQGGTSQA